MSLNVVEGAVIADRFCLQRPLGRGGMGEVWLAHDVALDAPCAVKLIDPEAAASPELRARFALEARSAAQIRSAHVVQILDTGVCEGTPYIAMEYLEGEDLRARLARAHVLDARGTASIITQVSRALDLAHAANIVHRDLKPGNLFLCREGDREIVKVLDFGIAKHTGIASGIQTSPDIVLGTLFYMSPEQAVKSRPVDHRTDLWALGVIAFRCLTGELPFKSATFVETLKHIIAGPIPVPSRIAPVPAGFDTWWARAASRDPDHRFQSAKELADSLQMALGLSGPFDLTEPSELARSPARASTASLPDTPSPFVAPIVLVAPTSTPHANARIAAAIAMMAFGGLAAWYVFPSRTTSVTRAQASRDAGALTERVAMAALPVAITAPDRPSAAPPPVSAASATTPPRTVVPLPSARPSPASSARPHIPPPVAPAKSTPAGETPFDPGF